LIEFDPALDKSQKENILRKCSIAFDKKDKKQHRTSHKISIKDLETGNLRGDV